eukprot:CAMPEP_0198553564 /NCGR_PEP_ID=MMETSP1462-20131121/80822_1 /TAXON_ID=1333877 /ORGANISM="Brandtodinium nutriculum, Strain RCC3387" /LENGTH=126 /DNA_ID=CAMNT_0044284253 /DNA_START=677 /DNA_END=1059 /DNA_ORIENTATION=+
MVAGPAPTSLAGVFAATTLRTYSSYDPSARALSSQQAEVRFRDVGIVKPDHFDAQAAGLHDQLGMLCLAWVAAGQLEVLLLQVRPRHGRPELEEFHEEPLRGGAELGQLGLKIGGQAAIGVVLRDE